MRLMPKSPLVLTAAALLLTACGDSTEPRIPAALELEHEAVEVEVNDSTLVNVVVLDQFGREFVAPPSGFQIDWHVQDPAVARVTDGYIVGLRTGSTTVAASAAGITPVEVGVDVVPTQFTGQLSFDYAGHASGSFEVSSDFSLDPERGPTTGEWVVAFHDPDFGSHDVLAVRTREDGSVDLAWFWVTGEVTAAGTHDVDSGVLVLGFVEALNAAEGSYEVVGGSVDAVGCMAGRAVDLLGATTYDDGPANIIRTGPMATTAPLAPIARTAAALVLTLTLLASATPLSAQATAYFFPEGERFDPSIPSPAAFLGYEIGTHHTRHDRIVAYMQELARLSERATYQEIGHDVRAPRDAGADGDVAGEPRAARGDPARAHRGDGAGQCAGPRAERKVIVHLGYGVHGNETSSRRRRCSRRTGWSRVRRRKSSGT
jgi:hypothetical protein